MTACRYAKTCQWRLRHGDTEGGCTVRSARLCDAAMLNHYRYPQEHIAHMDRYRRTDRDALLIAREIGGTPAAIAAIDRLLYGRSLPA